MSFVLVALLVVGGTFAWFTSAPAAISNKFVAGTVKVELHEETGKFVYNDGEYTAPEEKDETVTTVDDEDKNVEVLLDDNVNPGDKYAKEIWVENTGSKAVFIRVDLTTAWDPDSLEDIVELGFKADTKWFKHTDGYWYYTEAIPKDGKTELLLETVFFPGEDMDNDYQGAGFSIKVEVDSIQASNGAALDAWGVDPTLLVTPPAM